MINGRALLSRNIFAQAGSPLSPQPIAIVAPHAHLRMACGLRRSCCREVDMSL